MANLKRNIPWADLLALRVWTPLADAGLIDTLVLSDRVHKVDDQQYLLVLDSDMQDHDEHAPYITMIVWAETDGAALRAVDGCIEADIETPTRHEPPRDLLPLGASGTYSSIVEHLRPVSDGPFETAQYRIATDSAFIHKVIHSPYAKYFFRSPAIIATEQTYAIAHKLRP